MSYTLVENRGGIYLVNAARVRVGDMKGTKTLVKNAKFTDRQLRDLILEVVNASDGQVDGSNDELTLKYREFFPTWDNDIQLFAELFSRLRDPDHPDPNDPMFQKEAGVIMSRAVFRELRDRLRAVWTAGNENAAEWRLFKLQASLHKGTNFGSGRKPQLQPPSPDTPIEFAIDWVRRNLLMLRVCHNPECPSRFFVADRAQRQFCVLCVSASQKLYKRRWWRKTKELQQEPRMKAGARIVPVRRPAAASSQSDRRCKEFLQDIANAHENNFDYILKMYADAGFLPPKTRSERVVAFHPEFMTPEKLKSNRRQEMHQVVGRLRDGLRGIWSAADNQYTARWRLFSLQNEIWGSMDPSYYLDDELKPPPSADRLVHQAFGYLKRNLHMLRTCTNASCQTPLFVAGKGRQTHCSDLCALPAQREYKARWWREKGPEWREARRRRKKSPKPARKI